jgi:catechol 2,3-dioxygenase-like lactoylglutathione lyase family enzyme
VTATRDFATPNLPSRDFDVTVAFYSALGFVMDYRSPAWLILSRDGLMLEFFPWPDFDPSTSSFGACLRLQRLDEFVEACLAAPVPVQSTGWPRLSLPRKEASGERIGYLIDPDCSLLRLVDENRTP